MPLPPSTGTGLFVLNGDGVMKGLRGEHACAPIGAPVGMRSRRPFLNVAPPAPPGGARSSPPSIGGAILSRRRRRAASRKADWSAGPVFAVLRVRAYTGSLHRWAVRANWKARTSSDSHGAC